MDIAAKIEKNRIALLRMVGFWLFAARLLARKRERALPRCINDFVCNLIFKVEKAAAILVLLHAYPNGGINGDKIDRLMEAENNLTGLTTREIIARLEAVQQCLRKLPRTQTQKRVLQWFQVPRIAEWCKVMMGDIFTSANQPNFQPP